jgi:DNA-binding CsgD family transcriptional regulator
LLGRKRECETLDRVLDAARSGRSSVLVLRGESGVGKTALLEYLVARAQDFGTARAAGVELEMELAYAGLQQLCAPLLCHLEELPPPQRDALRVAFGLSAGPVPDCYLVGLAVLTLLSGVAEERPVLWVVDDAQWLDSASKQCLAFVARRLLAEPVAMVFAEREPGEQALAGLPELVVRGLADRDARLLLASAVRGPLDEQVRDRFIAEARGNPLALVELPRGLSPATVAHGFCLPDAGQLVSRIEQSFLERVRSLPKETRLLLLLAAAEPVGDAILLWRAAEQLGIGADAAAAAEEADLIEFGPRVRFRHPLVRSAAYHAGGPEDRQRVHRALAAVTDPALDPDRRAWHRAQAAPGPDETVAGELERSAERARRRGGLCAVGAFLQRAAELTPDPAARGARALAAAQAEFDAGAFDAASELVATAAISRLDELQRAQLELVRARIAYALTRGREGVPSLLSAAKRLQPLDPALARETYLEAMVAAIRIGRMGHGDELRQVVEAAGAGPPAPSPPGATDLMLDGLIARWRDDSAASVPMLKQALAAVRREGLGMDRAGWFWAMYLTALNLFEWDDSKEVSEEFAQLARETGALAALPFALNYLAAYRIFAGEFAEAAQLIQEAEEVTAATGTARIGGCQVLLAAFRGDRARTLELREAVIRDGTERGEAFPIVIAECATAMLYNSLGEYRDALLAARRALELDQIRFGVWGLPELVEAAIRGHEPALAAHALDQLSSQTSLIDNDWAAGIEARSRALLAAGQAADDLYRKAIEHLARVRMPLHLARAHLLYGEWLRREDRRVAARQQLRLAHDFFDSIGAGAFAERTRRELLATGEAVHARAHEARDELTAQEARIARLARDGQTNVEIGCQLFLSPRTVEYHLSKVFMKLNITSRRGLAAALPERERTRRLTRASAAPAGARHEPRR